MPVFLVYVQTPTGAPLEGLKQFNHEGGTRLEMRQPPPAGAILTRAGQKATMLLEENGMRISIGVICLQGGRLGQRIRVLDPVRRHIFRAEVLTDHRLRMTL